MINSKNCSLQDIAMMYRDHFVNRVAIIHVKDKITPIKIKFDQGHLAHLIGLHNSVLKGASNSIIYCWKAKFLGTT